ncbi:MAG: VWA domain-containing protein [Planctomycetes bacterium]|nr:VWA domain-containing protein [Planctomycetota bacterium]
MVHEEPLCLSGDASIAADQERAFDRAVAWLALYTPTIGTSVVLHAALVLLAAFLIPFHVQRPPEFEPRWTGFDIVPKPTPTVRRPRLQRQESVGKALDVSEVHLRRSALQIKGLGEDPLEKPVLVFGVASDRAGGGKEGAGRMFGEPWENVFPPPDMEAAKIVYLVDRSGSMSDSLIYVKYELKQRLAELEEAAEFHVIFYSSGPPVEMPTRRLVPATERNKELAFLFIDRVVAGGETDPSKALERAFACGPEVIYLLTDGEFDRSIVDLVRRLNTSRDVAVHTIGFLYNPGPALREIAAQNNGRYKFVSEQDLALLGR